jgi:hypothetical protein
VTLDTNATGAAVRATLEAACKSARADVEFAHTTVTDRETEATPFRTRGASLKEFPVYDESRYDAGLRYADPLTETWTLGESGLGEAALGDEDAPVKFEEILRIIGSGGFPTKRELLTARQRRQVRDAMVLATHTRERRDVLVSDDVKHFIGHGRRDALEALCRTRILTVEEFCSFVAQG